MDAEAQDGERRSAHRGDDAYRRDSPLGRRLGQWPAMLLRFLRFERRAECERLPL